MSDDRDECEWVNVSSSTCQPGCKIKRLCVCVVIFCVSHK